MSIEPAVDPRELLRLRGGQGKLDTSRGGPARIDIIGNEGLFEHSITKQRVESFEAAIVDWTNQRTLWISPMPKEKLPPICRSRDAETGIPHPEQWFKKNVGILDDETGNSLTAAEGSKLGLKVVTEDTRLSCEDCALSNWGPRDPATKKSRKPFCSESMVLYIIADFAGNGNLAPALLTVKGGGMGPAYKYFLGFEHAGQDTYSVFTKLSLELVRQSSAVTYSVPVFERAGETDPSMHIQWAMDALRAKDFLTSERSDKSDDDEVEPAGVGAKVKSSDLPDDF